MDKYIKGAVLFLFMLVSALPAKAYNSDDVFLFNVPKGATVYGIARDLSIPIDTLMKYNPKLQNGLKAGMQLHLPAIVVSEDNLKKIDAYPTFVGGALSNLCNNDTLTSNKESKVAINEEVLPEESETEWSNTHFQSKRVWDTDYEKKHHIDWTSLKKHNPHIESRIEKMWIVRPSKKHKKFEKIAIGGRDGNYDEKCWFFVRPGLTWQGVADAIGIPVGAIKYFNPGVYHGEKVTYAVFIAIPIEVVCKDGNKYRTKKDEVRKKMIKEIYKIYKAYFVSGICQTSSYSTGIPSAKPFEDKLKELFAIEYYWKEATETIERGKLIMVGESTWTQYTTYELSYKMGISIDSLRVIAEKGIFAKRMSKSDRILFREDLKQDLDILDRFFSQPYTERLSEKYAIYIPSNPNSFPNIETYQQYLSHEIYALSYKVKNTYDVFVKKGQNWKNTAETLCTTRIRLREANPKLNIGDFAEEDCIVHIPFNIVGLGNVDNAEEFNSLLSNYREKFLAGELDKDIEILEITPEFAAKVEKYDKISAFYEGRAAVLRNDKWGFIDLNGDEVIACQYPSSCNFKPSRFSNGIACVPDVREEDGDHFNIRVGFIDKEGKWILRGNFFSEPSTGLSLWYSIYHELPSVSANGICSVYDGFYDSHVIEGDELLINMSGEIVSDSPTYIPEEFIYQDEELRDQNRISLWQRTITGKNNFKVVELAIYDYNEQYSYYPVKTSSYYLDKYGNMAPVNARSEMSKYYENYVKEKQKRILAEQTLCSSINSTSALRKLFSNSPKFECSQTGVEITLSYNSTDGFVAYVDGKRFGNFEVDTREDQPKRALIGLPWLTGYGPAPMLLTLNGSNTTLELLPVQGEETLSFNSRGYLQYGRTGNTTWMRLSLSSGGVSFTPVDYKPDPEMFHFIGFSCGD